MKRKRKKVYVKGRATCPLPPKSMLDLVETKKKEWIYGAQQVCTYPTTSFPLGCLSGGRKEETLDLSLKEIQYRCLCHTPWRTFVSLSQCGQSPYCCRGSGSSEEGGKY